jgi:hypothetical protein
LCAFAALRVWRSGWLISNEIMHRVERELDLDDERLEI